MNWRITINVTGDSRDEAEAALRTLLESAFEAGDDGARREVGGSPRWRRLHDSATPPPAVGSELFRRWQHGETSCGDVFYLGEAYAPEWPDGVPVAHSSPAYGRLVCGDPGLSHSPQDVDLAIADAGEVAEWSERR